MLPPRFLLRPSHKNVGPINVNGAGASSLPLLSVPWVSDLFSGRTHVFPGCICVDSGSVYNSLASQLCFLPTRLCRSFGASVSSKSQSWSSDLCLAANLKWSLVALPSPRTFQFQASALKAMQRVCQLFRTSKNPGFAVDTVHGELQVRFVQSTAPARILHFVRLPRQVALYDVLCRTLHHFQQHRFARGQDVPAVGEYHMSYQQFVVLVLCTRSCFVTLSLLLPCGAERSQPVAHHHGEQGRTLLPSLPDGPVKAHFVDGDRQEDNHVPSSDLSRSNAVTSDCCAVHHSDPVVSRSSTREQNWQGSVPSQQFQSHSFPPRTRKCTPPSVLSSSSSWWKGKPRVLFSEYRPFVDPCLFPVAFFPRPSRQEQR